MSDPSSSPLSDAERAMLSVRADQFFEALRRGGDVTDFEPFLNGLSDSARPAVLTELVIIDLGHRWGRGDRPAIEDYVRRFPELGPAERVPPKLILEEYHCRAKTGQTVDLADYQRRFPVQFPAVREQMGPPRSAGGGPGPVGRSSDAIVSVSQQYDLVRELGRGMFGEVWLARKNPSGIEKAIKILLQPADRESAKRELRSLELIKNLRHSYLLATEDFWVADNRLYIVMELADFTLRGRLKQCKDDGLPGIPADELLDYIREAAEGLDYLHEKKITHRDVKPDNILVANGHAKVADFGLAREAQAMQSMSFAGTPAYMAPEIWGGEGGPPSDLYGLAVAYVELRQSFPPLRFGRGADVMFAHLDGQFEFADFIPEPERNVLRKAMARMPEERHGTCTEFTDALAAALGRPVSRRSGRVPVPGSRVLPPGSSVPPVAPGTQGPSSPGTVRTDTPPRKDPRTETRTASGTQVDRPPRPPHPRPGTNKTLLAATASAVLLAAIGLVLWLALGDHGGAVTPTDPTPTTKGGPDDKQDKKGNTNGGGPVDPPLAVPPGTLAEPTAPIIKLAGGRSVPEWVTAERAGQKVRFRLIVMPGTPFFMCESKVWNGLYSAPGEADAPVMNVKANEAATFAASFGGRLPTPEEWDHAAGFHDPRGQVGPVLASGVTRVKLPVPAPTHGPAAEPTRNQFDLIDLAGNGREWTRAVLPARGEEFRFVDGANFKDGERVVLRGRTYTARTPLTYEIMQYEQKEPQTQLADAASPYTGFRIVLPVP